MFHKSRQAFAVCCIAVTALAGTVALAAAAGTDTPSRVVLADGGGDVWRVNWRTSQWTLVGDRPAADVRRAVVTYRARGVLVRTPFVNLRKIGVQKYSTGIKTRDDDFYAEVTARPGQRTGHSRLYTEPGGEPIGCAGLAHRIDYARDMVWMWLPSTCLDDPPWVRANLGNLLVLGDAPHRRHLADNPHSDAPYSNIGTQRVYRD